MKDVFFAGFTGLTLVQIVGQAYHLVETFGHPRQFRVAHLVVEDELEKGLEVRKSRQSKTICRAIQA